MSSIGDCCARTKPTAQKFLPRMYSVSNFRVLMNTVQNCKVHHVLLFSILQISYALMCMAWLGSWGYVLP